MCFVFLIVFLYVYVCVRVYVHVQKERRRDDIDHGLKTYVNEGSQMIGSSQNHC